MVPVDLFRAGSLAGILIELLAFVPVADAYTKRDLPLAASVLR